MSTETIYPFNLIFIGSTTGMSIFNTGNPSKPILTGSFAHARLCDPVIADQQFAYVTLRSNGNLCSGIQNELDVIDISNLSNPKLIKTVSLTHPHGLSKDSNYLFICDGEAGLKVFNLQDPLALSYPMIQNFSIPETYDVIAQNHLAIVTAKDGIYQFDYNDILNMKQIGKIGIAP